MVRILERYRKKILLQKYTTKFIDADIEKQREEIGNTKNEQQEEKYMDDVDDDKDMEIMKTLKSIILSK